MLTPSRVRALVDRPPRPDGDWVLYWMISARRTRANAALERAAEHARALGRPLLVLEALSADHRWASDRVHRFVLAGMLDNARALERAGAMAWPYLEPAPGAGKGLLDALAARACVVVTDASPGMGLDGLLAHAARLPVRVEEVDGNGLLPLAEGGVYASAYAFRRHLQLHLRPHLAAFPAEDPLHDLPPPRALPDDLRARWPRASAEGPLPPGLRALPRVAMVGGPTAAHAALDAFLGRLDGYADFRNLPGGTSGLSPWLHFGHLGVHEVVGAVLAREDWSPARLSTRAAGKREGWWGLPAGAEAFLDELVTWRELGFQYARHAPGYDRYDTLPTWALATLERHAADPRPHLYDLDQLAAAETDDPVWNAAQRQLVREGRIHNYLRMLWGKRVLSWLAHPSAAWDALIELNNRYALDGRDPNSYTGIAWTFGRFDRPWGPERPIYGTIRYMSSANTLRKFDLADYLAEFAAA